MIENQIKNAGQSKKGDLIKNNLPLLLFLNNSMKQNFCQSTKIT